MLLQPTWYQAISISTKDMLLRSMFPNITDTDQRAAYERLISTYTGTPGCDSSRVAHSILNNANVYLYCSVIDTFLHAMVGSAELRNK